MSKKVKRRKKRGVDSFVDIDYWDKLSKEDRKWLRKFVGNHYYANRTPDLTPEEIKANDSRKNSFRADYWHKGDRVPSGPKLVERLPSPREAIDELIEMKKLDESLDGYSDEQ